MGRVYDKEYKEAVCKRVTVDDIAFTFKVAR
jgi:hypothetical protein